MGKFRKSKLKSATITDCALARSRKKKKTLPAQDAETSENPSVEATDNSEIRTSTNSRPILEESDSANRPSNSNQNLSVIVPSHLASMLDIQLCTGDINVPSYVPESHLHRYWNAYRFIDGSLNRIIYAVNTAGADIMDAELESERMFIRDQQRIRSAVSCISPERLAEECVKGSQCTVDHLTQILSHLPGVDELDQICKSHIVTHKRFDFSTLLRRDGLMGDHCTISTKLQLNRQAMEALIEPAYWDAIKRILTYFDQLRLSDAEYRMMIAMFILDPDRMENVESKHILKELHRIYFQAFTRLLSDRPNGLYVFQKLPQLVSTLKYIDQMMNQYVRYVVMSASELPWRCIKDGRELSFAEAMSS